MNTWVEMLPSFIVALVCVVSIIAAAVYLIRWLERPARDERDAASRSNVEAVDLIKDHPAPPQNPETPAPRVE